MTNIESLIQTDSQVKRSSKLQGFSQRWKQAKYVIHTAIYLDALVPIRWLSLGFQQNRHDLVKAVKRVKYFTLKMAKLTLLIVQSDISRLTFYKRLLADIEQKSIEGKTKYAYQDILCKFKSIKSTVKKFYEGTIGAITNRLRDNSDPPVFTYLVQIVNIHVWPKTEEQLAIYEDSEIAELKQHFDDLLLNASCKVENILPESDIKNTTYLDNLKIIFTNEDFLKECKKQLNDSRASVN